MGISINDFRVAIRIDNTQAKQKLVETEQAVANVKQELNELAAAGKAETAEYKQKQAQLDALNKKYYALRNEAGLTGMTYNELRKAASRLRGQLNNTVPGTEKWKQLQADLKIVDARMKELRGSAQQTSFSLGKLADGFNRYAAIGAGAVATLTGVALTMRGCVDEFAKMEEAESQVIKYTGMTKEEVKELNEEFKKMDTRTSREQLNELAGTAGRLGITSKKDVLEFVEAADMINVALGEDLGDDAIKNIGKLSDMFGDSSRSMKENMLAIGSAVNSVAQNSSASEPYLVEFTARMGGVAKQAGLAITDVMGFASALDQNMLRSEMASTALSGLIMKIYQEPAKYAKLAGMQVEEFTDLMTKDVNAAVLRFLESMGQLGGMDKMAPVLQEMKLSGAEAAGVISTLAGNVAKVRKEQRQANEAFVEGTSIIKENAVQNSTVQAELDKARKRLADVRVELGEKLLPAMKYMVSTGSLTVKGLSEVVSLFFKYSGTIKTVTTLITLYTIAVNASVIADKAKVFWTDKVVFSLRKLYTLILRHPYAASIAAITTIIALYRDWQRNAEKLTATERNLRSIREQSVHDIRSEKSELEQMLEIAKDENREKGTRLAAIKRLNEISPEYLGNLNLETIKTKEATAAVNAYVESLIAEQNIKNATNKIQELQDQRSGILKNGADEGFLVETMRGFGFGIAKAVNFASVKLRGFEDAWARQTMDSMANRSADLLRDIDQQVSDLDAYIAEQRQKLVQAKVDNKVEDNANGGGGNGDRETLYKSRLAVLEQSRMEEESVLQGIRDAGLIGEETYQKRLYDLDVKYYAMRAKLMDEFGKDSSVLQQVMTDRMVEESERRYKEVKQVEIEVEDEDIEEDNYVLEKFKNSLEGQEAILEAQREAGLISEEEYQDQLNEIVRQKSEQRAQIQTASMQVVADLAGSFSQLFSALMDGEIQKVESRYDKEIEAAKAAGKDTSKLEEQKEAEINAIKKKYADKQFAAAVLQVTATTAITAMEAYKAMAGIPVVGPALGAAAAAAALVAGAAQIAVAKQQRDEAKGLKSGGYSDDYVQGYTSGGNPDDVAGVIPVHKNEFVANHHAVANPHVKRFLDVFDLAQKDGSIRWLNTTQILEKTRTRAGYYEGGYTSKPTGSAVVGMDPGITAMLQRIIVLLQAGNDNTYKIANGGLYIDVRTVRDSLKKLERLESNVNR